MNDSMITDLSGRMLIAMPGMGDSRFEHSVVVMCDHSAEGAMGLIINKSSSDLDMPSLLSKLEIDPVADLSRARVHFGGPVEIGRGFVLHDDDYHGSSSTVQVVQGVRMTATLDVLEDIAAGTGPAQWQMMLGYAGWGAGQLEGELAQNAWLVCDASPQLIFDIPDAARWEAALESLGVSSVALSASGGRA